MKANELMIGDWVMHTDSKIPTKTNPFMAALDIPEWSPIPLNDEILNMNGIYSLSDDIEQKYDYCRMYKYKNGVTIIHKGNLIELKCLRYVHELQHALRLCGLNDLADNFKV